jgi:hypothetical protein
MCVKGLLDFFFNENVTRYIHSLIIFSHSHYPCHRVPVFFQYLIDIVGSGDLRQMSE